MTVPAGTGSTVTPRSIETNQHNIRHGRVFSQWNLTSAVGKAVTDGGGGGLGVLGADGSRAVVDTVQEVGVTAQAGFPLRTLDVATSEFSRKSEHVSDARLLFHCVSAIVGL